ncbi:MAG: hypothetical protein JNL12_09475, partial [Planctomycetes bacterium]|nr:hypothetical protein [Planctomycetota bacterium]
MNLSLRFMLSSLALSPLAVAQLPIFPGNILVSRIGDGTTTLSSAAAPRFLDEYTQTGVFVQTIALPTVAAGPQLALTNSGSATSEGYLSQSADGNYFILVGYDAAPGTAAVSGTTAATNARVIGRVDLVGNVDTSTGLTDAYSGNTFRSACSTDGANFWTGGTGPSGGNGARYVAGLGATTSTQLSTTVTNLRVVNIFNGQLYTSSQSGAFLGVSSVGTGLPTTSGQTITALATAAGNNNYDYFFADASTLYMADERTSGPGGIQKWTESGGVWTLAYTLQPNATTGCRGLSGFTQAGVTTLFATTTATGNVTEVVSVVDSGPGSAFTTLVLNTANMALRDVQFVRSPSQVIFSGTDCANTVGTPTQTPVGGYPVAGNANFGILGTNCVPSTLVVFAIQLAGPLPFGYAPFGVDAPPCALAYLFPDALVYLTADPSGSFL